MTDREAAIIAVAVREARHKLYDSGWTTWRRRCARFLSCFLMIDGISHIFPSSGWYITLPVWLLVALVTEWGWCGKLRDWSGGEVQFRELWMIASRKEKTP